MKKRLSLLIFILPLLVKAQNPIIRDQFTADPTARVFNDRVYLYPSHDIMPPWGVESCQGWFCMEDYHVFSSENLTEWTDHGVILTQNKVPWVKKNGYSMWAPDCVYKDGKYYFYFPSVASGGNFAIGVAVADKPEGPFIPESQPIYNVNGIDPGVLQASDGNAYLFWGNGNCAKLKSNMKEIEGQTRNCLQGLPNGQAEGPFPFEYNGNYYLSYPYVRKDTEVLAYAMSKNPLGPYTYKGLIMAEHANGCWTNHHSVINYKGEWYLFYHHNPFSPGDDKRRSVQIEKLHFNADGTIQEIKETMRGVGINKATEKIEIDRYSSASKDVKTSLIDKNKPFLSFKATLSSKGSWLQYNDVDFDCIEDGYLNINVSADGDTTFCIREGSVDGKILACIDMNKSKEWVAQKAPLDHVPSGVIDLVMTNEGDGAVSVDWITFINDPTKPKTQTTEPANMKKRCSAKIVRQGYSCCSENCITTYSDSDGDWGMENGQWCGCANPPQNCVGAQGLPCCTISNEVYFIDNYGSWGIENDEWCLVSQTCIGAQGLPCCTTSTEVYYTDYDGSWSIENDEWCIIR